MDATTLEARTSTVASRVTASLLGPRATRRLSVTHGIDDFADAMINVCLIGSLIVTASLDESRWRMLTYLLLTVAPLAVVSPAVGWFLDRTVLRTRTLLAGTQLLRAVLCVAIALSLATVAFYPLVFGVLVARRAYALTKTAMLSEVDRDQTDAVAASGHLARVGTVAGGAGTVVAGGLLVTIGAGGLLAIAGVTYVVAASCSLTLAAGATPVTIAGSEPVHRTVEMRAATLAAGSIRLAMGGLMFLLALAVAREGTSDWTNGAALAALGSGSFLGTVAAWRLHRRWTAHQVFVGCALVPALVAATAATHGGWPGTVATALAVGCGASVATRSLDGLYGREPEGVRGRLISRTEHALQVAEAAGAVTIVAVMPDARHALAALAAMLLAGAAWSRAAHRSVRIAQESASDDAIGTLVPALA